MNNKIKSVTLSPRKREQLLQGFRNMSSMLDSLQEMNDCYLSDIQKLSDYLYDLRKALKFNRDSESENRYYWRLEEECKKKTW